MTILKNGGKLIYLSYTRLDIAYAVRVVSRFMYRPMIQHMTAVMRILRYLKDIVVKSYYEMIESLPLDILYWLGKFLLYGKVRNKRLLRYQVLRRNFEVLSKE